MGPTTWVLLIWTSVAPFGNPSNGNCNIASTVNGIPGTHNTFEEWSTKEICEERIDIHQKEDKKSSCQPPSEDYKAKYMCIQIPAAH